MKGKIWKKSVAAALALLIVSGGVPIEPIADIFGDMAVSVSAATGEVDLYSCDFSDSSQWQGYNLGESGTNEYDEG